MTPTEFRPRTAGELIGDRTVKICRSLEAKVEGIKDRGLPLRYLFYGTPGVGKTTIADILAAKLVDDPIAITSTNGANVNAEMVRQWMYDVHTSSLMSRWSVFVINEVDTMSRQAQILLLSWLDELPAYRAVFTTSNMNLNNLEERFHSRFIAWEIKPPKPAEISEEITAKWKQLKPKQAEAIAIKSKGNVRAALLDVESVIDYFNAQ